MIEKKVSVRRVQAIQLTRKILLYLLCMVFLVFLWSPTVSADGTASLTVGQTTAKRGEIVTVPITLEANPGIAGLRIKIEYDSTRLRVDGMNAVKEGSALRRLTYVGVSEESIKRNPITVLWYGTANDSSAGVLVNVTFTVLNEAPAGAAAVTVICAPGDSINANREQVALSITNAGVIVTQDVDSVKPPQTQDDNSGSQNSKTDATSETKESKETKKTKEPKESGVIPVEPSVIPENIHKVADERTVFTIYGNNNNSQTQNDEITVSVPYVKNGSEINEIAENLVVYRVDTSGKKEPVKTSRYNEKEGIMDFTGNAGDFYIIAANKISFSDISEKDWFYTAVSFVTARGLFEGVGGNLFAPGNTMTRGMFLTVLARLDRAELSNYKTSPYSDTAIGVWYGPAIAWAEQTGIIDAGILSGCEPGTFRPGDNITREQMAVIFANYIKYKNLTLRKTETREFTDIEKADAWARTAIQSMRSYAIINGIGNNLYNPKGVATRAEVAQIFTNLINALL